MSSHLYICCSGSVTSTHAVPDQVLTCLEGPSTYIARVGGDRPLLLPNVRPHLSHTYFESSFT